MSVVHIFFLIEKNSLFIYHVCTRFVNVSFVSNLVYTLDVVLYPLLPTFISRHNNDRSMRVNQYEIANKLNSVFYFLVSVTVSARRS